MKKLLRVIMIITVVILAIWIGLTIWVEIPKGNSIAQFGNDQAKHKALIVYNPDPIYNLDEQVCKAFAEVLSEHHISTTVATVKAANNLHGEYDIYVFCANTYNWQPDWPTTGFIKKKQLEKQKDNSHHLGFGINTTIKGNIGQKNTTSRGKPYRFQNAMVIKAK